MHVRLAVLLLLFHVRADAQEVKDLDPHLHTVAQAAPPTLKLSWSVPPGARSFTLRRRGALDEDWTVLQQDLPGTTTHYDDIDVVPGSTYEYDLGSNPMPGGKLAPGHAYLLGGIDVRFRDDPGVVLLVIEQSLLDPLHVELDRLEEDLARDGWEVRREAVPATDQPPALRQRIQATFTATQERLRAVLLLGAVPRAFSGLLNPDGHPDHLGAWPADGYYADPLGAWTDTQELGGMGAFVNKAHDGKFDQTSYPAPLRLALGRVDPAEMPAFKPLGPADLVRRYLDHDHAYREGQVPLGPRGLVSDNFGYFGGEAFARVAWRDSAALFGADPEAGRPLFDALEDKEGYAFALGCGGGNPQGAGGVGSTADFVKRTPRAFFLGLFGSYFGDWSFPDDFLRAAIFGPGPVLGSLWFARPYAHLHSLGALASLGEAFRAGANNLRNAYDIGLAPRLVHQALLGDPTLRLFVTRAPTGPTARPGPEGLRLAWRPPAPAIAAPIGYHVYRRPAGAAGPALRITETPVATPEFLDRGTQDGQRYAYRIVAVERVTTGSGTFQNHSPGALLETMGAAPMMTMGPGGGMKMDAGMGGCSATGTAGASGAPAGLFGLLLWPGLRRRSVGGALRL